MSTSRNSPIPSLVDRHLRDTNDFAASCEVLSVIADCYGLGSCRRLRRLSSSRCMRRVRGVARPSPDRWPEGSAIPRDRRRPTLLIFLHPRCPCSLASLGELADILERSRDRVSTHAVVLDSPLLESGGRSAIDQALAGLPQIAIHRDTAGAEAGRFKATTSGHLMLYDVQGRLVFSGGITAAPGPPGRQLRSGRFAWLDCGAEEPGSAPANRRRTPSAARLAVATRSKAVQESRP